MSDLDANLDPPRPRCQWLTAEDLARELRLSTSSIYAQARAGKIPCVRLGASVRFPSTFLTSMESVCTQQIHASVALAVKQSREVTRALRRLQSLPNHLGI